MSLAAMGMFDIPYQGEAQTHKSEKIPITPEQVKTLQQKAHKVDSLSTVLIDLAKKHHLADTLPDETKMNHIFADGGFQYKSKTMPRFSVLRYNDTVYHSRVDDIYLSNIKCALMSIPENKYYKAKSSDIEVSTVDVQDYSGPIPNRVCRAPGYKFASYDKYNDANNVHSNVYTTDNIMSDLDEIAMVLQMEIATLEKDK